MEQAIGVEGGWVDIDPAYYEGQANAGNKMTAYHDCSGINDQRMTDIVALNSARAKDGLAELLFEARYGSEEEQMSFQIRIANPNHLDAKVATNLKKENA